jgi:Double zinc ribbon/zinc-ribbon domain
MATCTSCGNDVTGKKFCPECGTPVQPTSPPVNAEAGLTCPRCNSANKPGASFCMNCGSSLSAQGLTAMAATVQSQPLTRQCPSCSAEVPVGVAFCTSCGQSMQATATPATAVAPTVYCGNCGKQNAPEMRFCGSCGAPLATGTPAPMSQSYPQTGPYGQPSQFGQPSQYGQPSQFGQPQYPAQYPQQVQNPQYTQAGQQYPQQYGQVGQMGYQQQPMVGQQPMALRCPVCMAMSPVGTANCPGCRTNLAGVVPTPAAMQQQGQQGGFGNFLQGGGGMAVGALGGAAAVIGGEMLLHGIEREHDRGYERRDEGMLGDLGGLANDIGLF